MYILSFIFLINIKKNYIVNDLKKKKNKSNNN